MSQSKTKTVAPEGTALNLASDLPEFDRSLPMSLLRAREAVMKKFIPSLKEQGLSPQQWRVIRTLEQQNGLEISELAERCYLLMPSMSRIVQNLESRQLIERRSVASDQRKSALFITPKGLDLFQLIAPKSAERYGHITQEFGYGKLELLYQLLDELVVSLNHSDK